MCQQFSTTSIYASPTNLTYAKSVGRYNQVMGTLPLAALDHTSSCSLDSDWIRLYKSINTGDVDDWWRMSDTRMHGWHVVQGPFDFLTILVLYAPATTQTGDCVLDDKKAEFSRKRRP